MDSALATLEWRTFTQRYWHVDPTLFEYAPRGTNGPVLRAIGYRDSRGRLVLPPYQPHWPLEFKSTPTDAPYRKERQWLETARLLVNDMIAYGIREEVTFSPVVTDPRPWLWSWFRVVPRFTNFIDFPFTLRQADRAVRQQANKALRAGFACQRTDNLEDAVFCLSESESRQGFAYGVTLSGLEMAHQLLGPEALRVYLCRAPNGGPVSARVALHRQGGRACDWLAGTAVKHTHSGATQLLISYMLDDLQQAGAIGYNSCGADLEAVAYAKTLWGGRLMTQFSIQAYDFQPMKHLAGNMLRFRRRQKAIRRGAAAGRNGKSTNGQPPRARLKPRGTQQLPEPRSPASGESAL